MRTAWRWWGYNSYGQSGLGDRVTRHVPTVVPGVSGVIAVAAGWFHSLALSKDGTVMACGRNSKGQLGLGDTDDRNTFTVVPGLKGVVDIDAGFRHSIAVTLEGEVYTWGKGCALGQGGDEDTRRLSPAKVTGGGLDGVVVVQVAAGFVHSMALTAAGDLYTWGNGVYGRLGHGDVETRSVPNVVGGTGAVKRFVQGVARSFRSPCSHGQSHATEYVCMFLPHSVMMTHVNVLNFEQR